ncbi:MAG: response regulator [Methylomonas sp.]|jgi:two-component system chemotaxis response regulator CheY
MIEQQLSALHVLLVEPSQTQRQIIGHYLEDLGISDINYLTSGSETLAELSHSIPDLIISAMYLPDMTGVDLVRAIRHHEDSYEMAFLLISSETNIKYLEPIRQAGAIAILPKPFAELELMTALKATVDYLHPHKLNLDHMDIADLQILIVDDSEFSRKFISRIFRDIGIESISLAENGKQALQISNQHFFDLIVTDYNMPEMDGLELVKRLRADGDNKNVPILMVTSEQNINRLAAIEQAGVSALLDKPFDPESVRKIILRLLG